MDKKKNNQTNENASVQKENSKPVFESHEYLNLHECKLHHQNIYMGQLLQSLNQSESNIFFYSSIIVKQIIADSTDMAWHDFFEWLDTRFSWVFTHSVNVAVLSVMIAAQLGFSKNTLECIALGGLLHDVGKLLVPASIIQKESSLDEAQMARVKEHCAHGISLVEGCNLSDDCKSIILQHHERLDGSGYPHGLKSDAIHTYAKIVMIADVLDAMTSYRPYRPAKSIVEALRIIKEEGEKFSAEYVSIINNLLF